MSVGTKGVYLAVFALFLTGAASAGAEKYRLVYRNDEFDATYASLTSDVDGNLFAEQNLSSTGNDGVVEFRARNGYSDRRIVYAFGQSTLGFGASGGVTLDLGAILGENYYGGVGQAGTVFDLGRPSNPLPMALYAFRGGPTDGANPISGLTSGPNRLYYSTTQFGGTANLGVVFEINRPGASEVYHVIHDFGAPGDVASSSTKLVADSQGRLFGIGYPGGANGHGGIYMLQKQKGAWQYALLYSFGSEPDITPTYNSNLVMDNDGNLFGCGLGGARNFGGVFRLAPPAQPGGAWQETVIDSFGSSSFFPNNGCGLGVDPATDYILGATDGGEAKDGRPAYGALFSIKPAQPGGRNWVEHVQHKFFGTKTDGGRPISPPFYLKGTFYGGNTLSGSVYGFTP